MHDPIAAGRRAAARAVVMAVAISVLVAAVFLLGMGANAAIAAGIGGGLMAAGNAVAAWLAFGGGIQRAGAAFARLLVGVAGKWLVVMAGFGFALAGLQLPPVPMLTGLVASALAYLLASSGAMGTKTVERER